MSLVLLLAAAAATVTAQSCPESAKDQDGLCLCRAASVCRQATSGGVPQCKENAAGTSYFAPDCTDCVCEITPLIHNVELPTYGTVWYLGQTYEIVWDATKSVKKVDIKLYREVPRTGGSGQTRLVFEEDIQAAVDNSGSLMWTVPSTVTPRETYSVLVVVTGSSEDGTPIFQTTPVFAIREGPTGPCLPGTVSSSGMQPGCTPCPKGTFSFRTHRKVDVARCALLCSLDKTCKSFDFSLDDADLSIGTCDLSADNRATSLVHTFVPSDSMTQHFELDEYMLVVGNFAVFRGTYIDAVDSVAIQDTSVEACAAMCTRDPDCAAFMAGTGARRGTCVLSALDRDAAGDDFREGVNAQHNQLDFYERNTRIPTCSPGSVSPTGVGPTCEPCPKNSFSQDTPTSCQPCQDGWVTESDSATQCIRLSCPELSTLDDNNDCVCQTGAVCDGPGCQCSGSAQECSAETGGVRFFPAESCLDCTCSEGIAPPTIDFIFTPIEGSYNSFGEPMEIKYKASSGVRNLHILLYYFTGVGTLRQAAVLAISTPNTGVFTWAVPANLVPRDNYAIVIFHAPGAGEPAAPTHRNTGAFTIGPKRLGGCPPGEFNAETGARPCALCPIGTFSTDPKTCTPCPQDTTTHNPGSRGVDDCSIGADNPLFGFEKIPFSFIPGSNAGGGWTEAQFHRTPEECAQLCVDDPGCKSFDSGVAGSHQEGDCFLSYDNRNTMTVDGLSPLSALDFYEKKSAVDINLSEQFFTVSSDCFLDGHDEGGVFRAMSPESCAQLCLHDVCCRSFDAGVVDQDEVCYLSYQTKEDAESDFVCTKKQRLSYYEKQVSLALRLGGGAYDDTLPTAAAVQAFAKALKDTLLEMPTIDARSVDVAVTLRKAEDGAILADLSLGDAVAQAAIEAAVSAGGLALLYPPVFGDEFLATFADGNGPCAIGTVSMSGDVAAGGCQTCRANTYSTKSQTMCRACPEGTASPPGAYQARSCEAPLVESNTKNPLLVGDEWTGVFAKRCFIHGAGPQEQQDEACDGTVDLMVTESSAAKARLQATFVHGRFCDPSLGCRPESPGVSVFFYDCVVSSDVVLCSFDPNGWAGITDRSFVRENFNGRITVSDEGELVLAGALGLGSLQVTQRCQAAQEIGTFSPGDRWIGSMQCEQKHADRKAKEGELDVQRMSVYIQQVDDSGLVTALVDFDHAKGVGEYTVQGHFDAASICHAMVLSPTGADAWITDHPFRVPARVLSGSLSDDGEFFAGEVSLDPKCACLGKTPASDPNRGASCDKWGENRRWCYVGPECAGSLPTDDDNFRMGNCQPTECTRFQLARICATTQVLCEVGWTAFGPHCYRAFPAERQTHDDGDQKCIEAGGRLASIHSPEENSFVANLTGAAAVNGAWIGLQQDRPGREFAWVDAAPGVLTNWNDGQPSGDASVRQCAFVADPQGSTADLGGWSTATCNTLKGYVCKKASLGVDASCTCTGQVDDNSEGDTCERIGGSKPTFCYVSATCPRAVPAAQDGLFYTSCAGEFEDEPTTLLFETTQEPELSCHEEDEGTFTRDDGLCEACQRPEDCANNQFLFGACTDFQGPQCVDCDKSCGNCTGLGAGSCDACAEGYLKTLDATACVTECPLGQHAANGRGCALCDPSCGTCDGAGPDSCTSCKPGTGLFLSAGACLPSCPTGAWKDASSRTCAPCQSCDLATEFYGQLCGEDADASCKALRLCAADEYESVAPGESSDRGCSEITSCGPGEEEDAAPTTSSDRTCKPCDAGTYDDLSGELPKCKPCSVGSHAPPGTIKSCAVCLAGQYDHDRDAATECLACPAGQFQNQTGQATCQDAQVCEPAFFRAANATASRDVLCLPCPTGTFKSQVSNVESCRPFSDCPIGSQPVDGSVLTPAKDRECEPCEAGVTFKPVAGNSKCQAVADCPPGTEEIAPPTGSADRQCAKCDGQSFSAGAQAPCARHTVCEAATEYESQAPTSSTDRRCSRVSDCGEDAYEVVPAGAAQDRVCRPLEVCVSGEYESAAPLKDDESGQFIEDRACTKCSECPTGRFRNRQCNATADTDCQGCSVCAQGTYQTAPCTATDDTQCDACAQCGGGEYETGACTSASNRVCEELTSCGANEFEAVAPTPFSDRVCQKQTVCQPGEETVQEATTTTDRQCRACVAGVTYEDDGVCVPVTACSPGTEEDVAPTITADRACTPCIDGSFNPIGSPASCQPHTPCPVGSVEAPHGVNETADRDCRPCDPAKGEFQPTPGQKQCSQARECAPGERVTSEVTAESDRECEQCGDDSFSAAPNAAECTPWDVCGPGYEETSPRPSLRRNRVCSPCGEGTFKPLAGTANCKPFRVCEAGSEEAQAGNATTDRVCRACVTGFTFKATRGSQACEPVLVCPAGEEELFPPTASSDRRCNPCPVDTFKAEAGAADCVAVSPSCAAGTYEFSRPTTSTDRVCTPCDPAKGEFQDEAGQDSCKELAICPAGTFVASLGIAVRNTVCTSCPPGSISTADNSPSCDPCDTGTFQAGAGRVVCDAGAICGSGGFQLHPAAGRDDTTCQPCDGITEFQDARDARSCKAVTRCTADKEELDEPTASSDRTCRCIPGSTYQPGAFDPAAPCVNATACAASETVFKESTPSSDAVCIKAGSDGFIQLKFEGDFDRSVGTRAQKQAFTQTLSAVILALEGLPRPLHLSITLSKGSILAGVRVSDEAAVPIIEQAALQGLLDFRWPQPDGPLLEGAPFGPCPAGWWSADGRRPGCARCAAGSKSASAATKCDACPANTWAEAGSSTCTACPLGTFSDSGDPVCTAKCAPGFVSDTGRFPGCAACNAGTQANPAQTACTACPANTFSAAGESCKPCPEGTTAPQGTIPGGCKSGEGGTDRSRGDNNQAGSSVGVIVGTIVGVLVLVAIIVLVVVLRRKRGSSNLPPASTSAWKEEDAARTAFSNPLYANNVEEPLNPDPDSLYGYSEDHTVSAAAADGGYSELQDAPPQSSDYMQVAGSGGQDAADHGDGGYMAVSHTPAGPTKQFTDL